MVDDDGFLFLVDRAKDLIIVSGFNVFPAEVEEVLLEHPAIEPRPRWSGCRTPTPARPCKAYVVARAGMSIEEDDVIDFVAERLARYKCPNKVVFVDEIPVGLGGKVIRRALREEAAESGGRRAGPSFVKLCTSRVPSRHGRRLLPWAR